MADSDRNQHDAIIAFAVIIFIFIVGIIGWNQGFQSGQESHQNFSAEAYENQSDREIADTCASQPDAQARECIAKAIRSSREQQRAEEDLDAQQEMSHWTKWMLLATALTATITLFGVIFVKQTLEATREMVSDTKEMARDARNIGEKQARLAEQSIKRASEANKIAESAIFEQSRPFIYVSQIFANEDQWRSGESNGEWEVFLKNLGERPALIKTATAFAWVGENETRASNEVGQPLFNFGFAGHGDIREVMAGETIKKQVFLRRLGQGTISPDDTIKNEEVMKLQQRALFGWLEVHVTYEDLRGIERKTNALFRMQNFLAKAEQFGGRDRNYRT